MKTPKNTRLAILLVLLGGTLIGTAAENVKPENSAIKFSDADYFHRWSKADQHEYTPRGQEDLEHWADMVTVNYYRSARDGEALSKMANSVIDNYKSHQGIIVRTDSVPRTPEKPAEYLIVALFPRPDFMEAVFARFKIVGGVGASVVYSHREYGKKSGDLTSAWLTKNGPTTEKTLMSLEKIPALDESKK